MPSVGLRPVGSQVGEATWSFRCAGGSRSEWSWVAGPPDPRSLQPVRETRSGRLSRNIPVQAMSSTTGGWLFLESGLEHELATWLDRQRDVTWLVGQPVLLRWGDGTKHFPDVLSAHRDGSVTIGPGRAPAASAVVLRVTPARPKARTSRNQRKRHPRESHIHPVCVTLPR